MTEQNLAALNGITVLLADDEEINRLLVQAILAEAGLDVTVVDDGQEALTAAANRHFDIIILDIQMPVVDGFEACTLLRQMEGQTACSTPIIAMTAHGNANFRQQCLEHGFNDYIAKPFKSEKLLAKITDHSPSTSVTVA